MMENNLIVIRDFHLIGQDERGMTCEFQLPRHQHEFVYLARKKGSISGNTYHTGKNATTKPKIFILLKGQILLTYRQIGNTIKYQNKIKAPSVIEINPYVTHQVEALEDFILLEGNSIQDVQSDRIKEAV